MSQGPLIAASEGNLAVSLAGARPGSVRAGAARRRPQGAEEEIGFDDEDVHKGEYIRATPEAFECFHNYHGVRHTFDDLQDEVKPAPERRYYGTGSRSNALDILCETLTGRPGDVPASCRTCDLAGSEMDQAYAQAGQRKAQQQGDDWVVDGEEGF